MTTARAQDQQRQAMARALKKSGVSSFFLSEYPTVVLQRVTKEIAQRNNRNSGLFFFYQAKQISCEELTDRAN
jgi:hypothetical protein